ncbi:MAG: anaerobic ribonucleoside-triphosphate reductase activating protein [bacterium]|nr:anaerobic ribonucleoside-triphosphate reductase activating protein [bacterium]
MLIGGLQKLTLIDYPGKIAATVFLVGCNFACPWCYNPELVLAEDIKKHAKISEKDFFDFLKKRKGLLDGVVICGGEPTINKNLPDFIKKIKKLGYAVKLDTNGSNPEMLKNLIDEKLIDYVAMDIKASLTTKNLKLKAKSYDEATGVKTNLNKIKKSIEIIKKSGIDYEFRTTIIPKLHQSKDIIDIAKQLKGAKKYFLQQFKPEKTINPKYEKYKPFSQKQLETIQKECKKYLPTELRNL